MTKNEAIFSKDLESKKLTVVRAFDAPVEQVWEAWTTSEMLDRWWAPKPYRAETKTMDFRDGGLWLYCMVGPDGSRHWCRVDYQTIDPGKRVVSTAMFCDEEGHENLEMPRMHWKQAFGKTGSGTTVTVVISFDKTADMEMIIKMGFQEGFTMGMGNLEELFYKLTLKS